MKLVIRLLMLLLVVPAITTLVALKLMDIAPFLEPDWISFFISFPIAVWAGWFVWKKSASAERGPVSSVIFGAILGGGMGTLAGFFIPWIFPSSYPLMGSVIGIMQFGPLGLPAGAVGGFAYWWVTDKKGGAVQEKMEGS
jgi:hypothetical protein